MSDKEFKPTGKDPAKQHFADAAMDELTRLGRHDDESFLARMDEALDEIDFETDLKDGKITEMPRSGRRKSLWISSAAAAVFIAALIPVFQIVKFETHRADSPLMVIATVPETNIESHESNRGETHPYEATDGVLEHYTYSLHKDNGTWVEPGGGVKPSAPSMTLAQNMDRKTTKKSYSQPPSTFRVDVAPDSDSKVEAGYASEYIFKGVRSDFDGLAEVPRPTSSPLDLAAIPTPATPTTGWNNYYLESALPIAIGDSATLTPYVGYNGTPSGRIADNEQNSSQGANANDVLYGGVSISVDFGESTTPKPIARERDVTFGREFNSNDALSGGVLSAPFGDEIAIQPGKNVGLHASTQVPEPLGITAREVKKAHAEWMKQLRKNAKIQIAKAGPAPKPKPKPAPKNEKYGQLVDNPFSSPLKAPLSTFSVDVDTASYTNIRRMVSSHTTVQSDSVRIEEMINYFSYDYPQPGGDHPFAFAVETAGCPWNSEHQLMRVGIQGRSMDRNKRPAANLVFLLDVSGSMNPTNKLPLVKKSMSLMIEELTDKDTVSIVVYAGAEGLCLPPTPGTEKEKILATLNKLKSGGSTNGGAGIQLAYQLAKQCYKPDGINRVILCTDGDFNVGKTDEGDLVKMVEKRAKDGTFLSVLGFGSGNINDSMLEKITNKGDGNYYYIDSLKEGRKVLLQDLMSTLVTIAKDVKIQIEFNPKHVQHYRLIGYANRMLKAEDFENDKVDAGEIGAGHSVTALYEIVPAGAPPIERQMSNLKYQEPTEPAKPKMKLVESDELCTLKLRYKLPKGTKSIPMEQPVNYKSREWKEASDDYQFSAAVALWGMLLRDGEHCGAGTAEDILEMAKEGKGGDAFGRRDEFIGLVKKWDHPEKLGGKVNLNDAVHGGVRFSVEF